ncbi:MAG: hypothetical protein ACNA7W_18070 [Pseudomonadales bacterium]
MAAVDEELAKLRKDMEQLRGDIMSLTEAFKDLGAEKGRAAMARAKSTGASVLNDADALKARAHREIEERPIASVLTSFGIGFLVGMLLDRRS